MLLIDCPFCGPRDETEFRYGGPSHIARPGPSEQMSDGVWGAYLFMRTNPKGIGRERWVHSGGCRQWFNLARHTVTHEIISVYQMGQPPPPLGEDEKA